ncbi:MAG TPA: TIGR02391 family protein [Gemmatimonadales bacterium]|nr:TIGR02391 family protein [Gemmatimonadales bacterium]
MPEALAELERIARRAYHLTDLDRGARLARHPFVERDIHDALPSKVSELFDDGHFAEATYAAFKFLDGEVQRLSGLQHTGRRLMMEALNGDEGAPPIRLTPLGTTSEKDEQEGYRFLFAGSMIAIRNPRGHEHTVNDDLETCLGHLSLATLLLRRLERAGYRLATAAPSLQPGRPPRAPRFPSRSRAAGKV